VAIAINLYQLGVAIRKESQRKGRKGPLVNKQLVFTLAYKVAELYSNKELHYSFEEALRSALNEFHIRKEWERDNYRWVMGSYFGTHGARKKVRDKAVGKVTAGRTSAKAKAGKKADKPLEVFEEKDGSHQLAFKA